jgi:predicted PurR-regulated permease PerM
MKKTISKITSNLKSKRGAEILQVVLIGGILLVLIITLFYPQIEQLFNNIMTTISNWFTNTGSQVFK